MITLGGHLLFQDPTVNTGTRLVIEEPEGVIESPAVGVLESPVVGVIDDDVECN